MIYNFPEMKKQNDLLEDKLLEIKSDYQKKEMSKEQFEQLLAKMDQAKKEDRKDRAKKRWIRSALTVAACAGMFVVLSNTSENMAKAMGQVPFLGQLVEVVTFHRYEYESERNSARIEVPQIEIKIQMDDADLRENLEESKEKINAEIRRVTDELMMHFETYLEEKMNYHDVVVTSEVLLTTQEYFTLKLCCYQGNGSGYQWNYYYTIDLGTGEYLQLKDVFKEDADYITVISQNIKKQMKEQMSADRRIQYWIGEEVEELNFQTITEQTSFYLNEKGNVVICFDEGDVAPMYMGAVEFEIPAEQISDIRK